MSQEETKPLTKEQESAELSQKAFDAWETNDNSSAHDCGDFIEGYLRGHEAACAAHKAEPVGKLEWNKKDALNEGCRISVEVYPGEHSPTIIESVMLGAEFQFNKDRERLAEAMKPRHYEIKNSELKEENEKLRAELAEKDALLVAKDNELCRALSEVKPLKLAIKQFKVWGTDGCRGKDDTCQGRLTLFIKSDKCLDCEYKTQGGVE